MNARLITLAFSFALLNACGGGMSVDSDAGVTPDNGSRPTDNGALSTDNGTALATVSGAAINHSMNRLAAMQTGRTPSYTDLTLEAVSVDALAVSPSAAALAGAPLNTAMCAAMGACAWSLAGVNVAGASLGLAARIRDNRTAGPLWVTTLTGCVSPAEVAAVAQSGLFENGRAFAVSRDAIDRVVAPMVGLTGDQVMERGFIFGLIYNPFSGRSADGSGTPVVGATVAASNGSLRIVYPNNMFSGTASATTNQGAFLAVPNAPGAVITTTFTVTPPAGGTQTWDASRVAVVTPNAVFFAPMYAR